MLDNCFMCVCAKVIAIQIEVRARFGFTPFGGSYMDPEITDAQRSDITGPISRKFDFHSSASLWIRHHMVGQALSG